MSRLKNKTTLKTLRSQRDNIRAEIVGLVSKRSQLEQELELKNKQKEKLDRKIKELQNSKDIIITEHALIRYLERVQAINMDEIRKEMVSEEVKNEIMTLGSGLYPIKKTSKFKLRVDNNVIITVIEDTKNNQ